MSLENLRIQFGRNYEDCLAGISNDLHFFSKQQTSFSCGVSAQQQILEEDLGKNLDEFQLISFAKDEGLVGLPGKGAGTSSEDLGAILERFGYSADPKYDVSPKEIQEALAEGKEVIVAIDSSEFWRTVDSPYFNAAFRNGGLDHAVRVHSYHPHSNTFTIFDPGSGDHTLFVSADRLGEIMNEPGTQSVASFISLDVPTETLALNVDTQLMEYTIDNPTYLQVLHASNVGSSAQLTNDIGSAEVLSEFFAGDLSTDGVPLDELAGMEISPEIIDGLTEISDNWDALVDVLDVASTGVDIVDGISTLGLGLLAGWIVKGIYQDVNDSLRYEIESLISKIKPKIHFAKLLELGLPISVLQENKRKI